MEDCRSFFGGHVEVEKNMPSTCVSRSFCGKSENAVTPKNIWIISCDLKFWYVLSMFRGKWGNDYPPKKTKQATDKMGGLEDYFPFGMTCVWSAKLVGGFNPFEKYESKWESSPNRGENKKYLKPPPSKNNFFRGGLILYMLYFPWHQHSDALSSTFADENGTPQGIINQTQSHMCQGLNSLYWGWSSHL